MSCYRMVKRGFVVLLVLILLNSAVLCHAASYAEYKKQGDAASADDARPIVVGGAQCIVSDGAELISGFGGQSEYVVLTKAAEKAEFAFDVPVAGNYVLKVTYYCGNGNTAAFSRDILLDGYLPFDEAAMVSFSQPWRDVSDEKEYDIYGNQIRSKQEPYTGWLTEYVYDNSGNYGEPLRFYLTAGKHTLSLSDGEGDLIVDTLAFIPAVEPPEYRFLQQEYAAKGYKNAVTGVTIQAEDGALRSDRSMYALADRTSPTVSPYSASKTVYNTIGGTQWKLSGQWIEWNVTVEQDALYKIGMHFKQGDKTGDVSVRECYIDGELPFAEAANLTFGYDGVWQFQYLGDEQGEPYLFYLTAGTHTVRLKVGLGDMAESILEAGECLGWLNSIYRRIVVITGSSPDLYRDYQLDVVIPEVFQEIGAIYERLDALQKSVSGSANGASTVSAIKRLMLQLTQMQTDSDVVASILSSFQENISSFGTWINNRKEQPLTLDTVVVAAVDGPKQPGEANLGAFIWHYIKQFIASFVTDYDTAGVTDIQSSEKITVWIAQGRDQSIILKQLINDTFTPDTSIAVDLKLVAANALLPSIISRTAPDVYIGMGEGDVVNMALREAVTDISGFSGYDELKNRFSKEAMTPFTYNGGVWAVPDTMSFYMTFYRKDILEEIGIKTDDLATWDSILNNVLPELQVNSLSFGVPVGLNTYLTFLYQNGGELYWNDGRESALSSKVAVDSMKQFTKLYTQYGLPYSYDFANRFHSGEMPVAIVDYLQYNQLTVFAPEIKGLWSMLPVPGTQNGDGVNNQQTVATYTASVIMSQSDKAEEAFGFLKWWTSADTQLEYGSNLESVVGPAARYNSANIEAINATAWGRENLEQINKQIAQLRVIPEVPGGYLTSRYYDFAFRDIAYQNKSVKETMVEAVKNINAELAHKRQEYNVD